MKIHYLLPALLISACVFSQTTNDWENPEVFAINKEATRATSLPYPSAQAAIVNDSQTSEWFQLLNGSWKFKWLPRIADVPQGFFDEKYNAASWGEIPVPGNWEFNGHGLPFYVNIGYGFKAKIPNIDKEYSPTGLYRQEFNIPDQWDNRRVFIHFEAGTNSMYLWVNGKKVGYTQNSKSPAEFDITPYIRKGKNLLACEVHKFSDGYYLEDQDMWRLGGIIRNVYLYSTAQTRILDFFAHPDLDANYKNGLFSVDITLKNYTQKEEAARIEAALFDKTQKKIIAASASKLLSPGESSLSLDMKLSNVAKWTAETPYLYTLLITLRNDKGDIIEATSHKIGFRKVEIKDGQLFLNGKKIYFKGVDLHEFNTNTGQVVSREVMLRNIQLMKELNINAVRTSHYPQAPLWYDLCDEHGIYLVDEANLESHGMGYGPENPANFPEWQAAHLDRMIRLVERDKNHPSVIIWSLGNEAGNGTAFKSMYAWAKERDKSRPVQYERAGREANTDIICPMYPGMESMIRDAARDLGRPFVMCEYAHAMGNSMGNMQEYWDVMRSSKNMQGGFIWEWYNHGFASSNEQGRPYWAYGGDLKAWNHPNDGNFCMDGMISPDQQYIPHTYIVKKVYQNILFKNKDIANGLITVINDYRFTDLTKDNFSYKWVILKNGQSIAEGSFEALVPADSQKDIKLSLPPLPPSEGTEYFLQIYAFNKQKTDFLSPGFEVAKEEIPFPQNKYFPEHKDLSATSKPFTPDRDTTIAANGIEYRFAKNTAFRNAPLIAIRKDGKNIMETLPRLNFWRAPTDNDFGSNEQRLLRIWDAAGQNIQYTLEKMAENDKYTVLTYNAKPRGIEASVTLQYLVAKDGSLSIKAHYKAAPNSSLPEMMRFGMIMSLPAEYDNFTWYGRGPHENYVDRNADAFMGIWSGKVQEQAFPYYRPQETGNKTDVRWLTLKDANGHGIRITGLQPLSVSATNNFPEDLDPGLTKKQQHPSDIIPRPETVLAVDLFQRGVAGLNSWGARPLDKYRFNANEYEYSYTIHVE
jgi:beta-galactosidase